MSHEKQLLWMEKQGDTSRDMGGCDQAGFGKTDVIREASNDWSAPGVSV